MKSNTIFFIKKNDYELKKSSHMKGCERMKNCIWLLQKSAKACPQRLPAMLLVTLLDAVNAVNIILFYKYAVQALYQEEVLKQMAIVVGIYLAVHVIHSVVNNYLTQVNTQFGMRRLSNHYQRKFMSSISHCRRIRCKIRSSTMHIKRHSMNQI